jgi:hypothetical protein
MCCGPESNCEHIQTPTAYFRVITQPLRRDRLRFPAGRHFQRAKTPPCSYRVVTTLAKVEARAGGLARTPHDVSLRLQARQCIRPYRVQHGFVYGLAVRLRLLSTPPSRATQLPSTTDSQCSVRWGLPPHCWCALSGALGRSLRDRRDASCMGGRSLQTGKSIHRLRRLHRF